MNFSHDTLLILKLRLGCGLAVAWVLTATSTSASVFTSPQRPATSSPVNSTAVYRSHNHTQSPYLAMIGPAPLRFAEGERALPPEPVLPTPPPTKQLVGTSDPGQKSPLASSEAKPTTPNTENTELDATLTPSSLKPVTILPDDTRREIRAEDVLPFFQFPGASDNGGVEVPFTSSQPRETPPPRSSATYQQQ